MAKKRLWMGSHGPYFFEDTKQVNDPDGVVTENQAGMVTEGKVTALEGVNDSTGILRLKAQAEPSDPSAGYGFFWMDTSYNIHFKAKDSSGNIRSYRLFQLPLDLTFSNVSVGVAVANESAQPVRAINSNDISSETMITNPTLGVV